MKYRQLGNTNVRVSTITFGAWAIGGWMWGGTEKKDALEAILASYDYGVTSIDTAPIYGQGLSEEIVGKAISTIPRDKVQILTKFGMRWDETKGQLAFSSADNSGRPIDIYKYAGKESIIKECEDSLRRLGTDYIDLYQIHWPDSTTPVAETMEALAQLLRQGKIRAAGVSNYSADLMAEAEKTINLASNQVPYSMVERSIEKELVPYCLKNNKAIIAYSPMQRGLLTGKIRPDHVFAAGDHRPGTVFFQPENIRRIDNFLDRLQPLAHSRNAEISQLVLRWTVEQPGITIALAGARNKQQAIQNAKAAYLALTPEDIKYIDGELRNLRLVGEGSGCITGKSIGSYIAASFYHLKTNTMRHVSVVFRLLIAIIMIQAGNFAYAAGHGRQYYRLSVYHFKDSQQEKILDQYFSAALLPALHRMHIVSAGVFKALANDTASDKKIYVFIPFTSARELQQLNDELQKDKNYQVASQEYSNAGFSTPPYTRIETIILYAFPLAPRLQLPELTSSKNERVYELRSYESATEKIFQNKVNMFNDGDEIGLFKRLGFNGVFYSEVIAGPRMPNLMYMTTFENMEDREKHWKAFSDDAQWKKLSGSPEYQHNVQHADIIFLRPTEYSDI